MRLRTLLFGAVFLAACSHVSKEQLAEQTSDRAGAKLDEAERAMKDLDCDAASARLGEAQEILKSRDLDLYPEAELVRSRLVDGKAHLDICRQDRAKRDLDALVMKTKATVEVPLGQIDKAVAATGAKEFPRAAVDGLREAIQRAQDELAKSKDVETKSPVYAKYAADARRKLDDANAHAVIAGKVVEFRGGPGAARAQGTASQAMAKDLKDPAAKLAALQTAQAKFTACSNDAQKMFAATPDLDHEPIDVDGTRTSLWAVANGCKSKADALTKPIAQAQKQADRAAKKAGHKKKSK